MDEPDRLRPLFPGRRGVCLGKLARRGAGQRRFERMVGAPPHFRREVVPSVAERLDRDWKEQRLADAGGLRAESLLSRLGPERGEVRWDDDARDDLSATVAERCDLRAEIVGEVLIAPGIEQLVPLLLQRRRKAPLRVTPCIAVAVIGEERSHDLVGLELAPHAHEDGNHVLEAPEEMVGPVEPLLGLAASGEEPRLPRRDRRDARRLVELALIGDRIGRLRGRSDQHQVDLAREDEVGRDLGSAVRVGLAVLDQDLDRERARPGLDAVLKRLLHLAEHEGVGFGKGRERSRLRADIAELERRCSPHGRRGQHRRGGAGGRALQNLPARRCPRAGADALPRVGHGVFPPRNGGILRPRFVRPSSGRRSPCLRPRVPSRNRARACRKAAARRSRGQERVHRVARSCRPASP